LLANHNTICEIPRQFYLIVFGDRYVLTSGTWLELWILNCIEP
jgi:hypothetical protein